jgi:HAD superfamily hydrolase (TIGR01549 family)
MKGALQLVLFDLGNTLLHDDPHAWPLVYRRAEGALWNSLRLAGVSSTPAELYGGPDSLLNYYYDLREPALEEPGIARILEGLLAQHEELVSQANQRAALDVMYSQTQSNWFVEDDAAPTLEALRAEGLRLGAVSNGADDLNAQQLVEKAGLREYLDLVLSSAAFGLRKPHPAIFQAALDHFGASAESAAMVGDSYEADIVGAHALGLKTVWVTRRVRRDPAGMPVRPDFEVKALGDIPALMR